jgi:photosystem II stability/assembly factor-like uncharacterized protein
MPKRYFRTGLRAAMCLLAVFLATPAPNAPENNTPSRMVNAWDQLAPMKAYYESRAEWPPHYGWKAFKRLEWDLLQRGWPNGNIPLGAVWEAIQDRGRMPRQSLDETWVSLGPNNHGGRSRGLRFLPGSATDMFAGCVSGGLFKSTDGGSNWFSITDQLANLAVGCFEIDPSNSAIMFLGTGEGYYNGDAVKGVGLLKSTDGGATWNTTGLNYSYSAGNSILKINIDPRNGQIVLASTNSALYRSTNGGTSFSSVLTGDVKDLVRDPSNPDILLAAPGYPWGSGNNGVFRSTNNGTSWTRSNTGIPTDSMGRMVLAFAPSNSQIVYAGVGNKSTNGMVGIFRSTDNGQTWTKVSPDGANHYSGQSWYDMAICVKPDNPNTVYSSGLDLYRSTDGGASWTQLTYWYYSFGNSQYVHADHHEIRFRPGSTTELWESTDGGIFKSTNSGDTWTEKNTGFVTFQYYGMGNATLDTLITFGGTQDNGTFKYSGSVNHTYSMGGDGAYCVVDYTTNSVVYAEYQNGSRYRSDNGGSSFSSINSGIDGTGAWVTPMTLDPFNHLILYTTTTNGKVWKSTNQGRSGTWSQLGQTLATGSMQVIAASPMVSGRLYLGNSNSVYRYETSTGQWTDVGGNLPGSWVTRVVPDPFRPDVVYVTFSGFGGSHVYKSTQAGTVWTNITGNLPNVPFQDLVVDMNYPNTLYAGGDIGVYGTTDGGQSWQVLGNGMPAARVDDMEPQAISGRLRVATHGRGLWEVPTSRPAFAVVTPNSGESVYTADPYTINWTCGNLHDSVKIELKRNYPGGTWETLFANTPNDGSESWSVTGTGSSQARIRISGVGTPATFDESNGNFNILQRTILVTAPNNGETWVVGAPDTIRWTSSNLSENVKIELNRSYPSPGTWTGIIGSTADVGSYVWTVTSPTTATARVRISGVTHTTVGDTSNANFTIDLPRSLTVITPNGGQYWDIGSSRALEWTSQNISGNIRIELNRSYPSGNWESIADSVSNTGSCPWVVTGPATTSARVRLTSLSYPTVSATSFGDFAIYVPNNPPEIIHDFLHDQEPVAFTVTAHVTDDHPGFVTRMLYWPQSGGLSDSVLLVATGHPDEFAASVGPLPENAYCYFLRVTDAGGLCASTDSFCFEVRAAWGMLQAYDDGTAEASHWSEHSGYRWAVKFDVTTPYYLYGAYIGVSAEHPDTLHSPIRVQVFLSAGLGGLPGTSVWSRLVGSIGNVMGGIPADSDGWTYVAVRDSLGNPLVLNGPFYLAVGNETFWALESFLDDTAGTLSNRSYVYDPCDSTWFAESDADSSCRRGNRMIRASGFALTPPNIVVHLSGNDMRLDWNQTGAPYYQIYSAAAVQGPYATLEGTATTNSFTDAGAAAEVRKFYIVQASTTP